MQNNNRGFSLVELLAVIVILGILAGVSVVGVTRYLDRSRKQSYETMEQSAYEATQNYLMAEGVILQDEESMVVDVETLVEGEYLEPLIDPTSKNNNYCDGKVVVEKVEDIDGALEQFKYTVTINCSQYKNNQVVYPKDLE